MQWRMQELRHFEEEIKWLPAPQAKQAYSLAHRHYCRAQKSLNPANTTGNERLALSDDFELAKQWLLAKLPSCGELVVVFENGDCFTCSPQFFIENWEDIFLPTRDDATVFAELDPFIMFHCHENEIEVAQRIS